MQERLAQDLPLKFTLDTNCIIAVEERRSEAPHIEALVAAHHIGRADVAIGAMSASERTKSGTYIKNYKEFAEKLRLVGMSGLNSIHPLCYMGVSFIGHCRMSGPALIDLERAIHRVLFPQIEFTFGEYCAARGLDRAAPGDAYFQWRNAKCDVQAMWAHIHERRDIFVTSDRNFHKATKKQKLTDLGAGKITTPQEAAAYLFSSNFTSPSLNKPAPSA